MKVFLLAGVASFALAAGVAVAQTTSDTVTTQSTTSQPMPPPPMAAPPVGTLSTTRTTHAMDANGNRVDSDTSTYRDSQGVAEDRQTTTVAAPAPPPTVSSSSSSTTTTTQPR